MRIAPLRDPSRVLTGYLIIWSDITDREKAEVFLRRQLEDMTVIHLVATACLKAEEENDLIRKITKIIGSSIYTDNFGVLMLDPATGTLHVHPSYHGVPDQEMKRVFPPGEGITGQVAASGQAQLISDVSKATGYIRFVEHARSELCVAIKVGEQILGVINVESAQLNAFTKTDQRLLDTLAGMLGTSILRLRSEAASQLRGDQLMAVTRVSQEITSVLDRRQVLSSIARRAAELSQSDACGVFDLRSDGRFYLAASYGISQAAVNRINAEGLPMEGSAVGSGSGRVSPGSNSRYST